MHPKNFHQRFGYSDIGMTLTRYSHGAATMQRKATDFLDAALDRVAAS